MGLIGDSLDSVRALQIRHALAQAVSLESSVARSQTDSDNHFFRTIEVVLPDVDRLVDMHTRKEGCRCGYAQMNPGDMKMHEMKSYWESTLYSVSEYFGLPGIIVASALIIWKGLICITGSESPVVVVLSGSMEPGFRRGDILFLHMSKDPIHAGEIVVYHVDGKDIPIVHRVIKVHERQDGGEADILTKGDKNLEDDRLLYAHGQLWLQQHHIMGRAVGFLPYVGWVTIVMTEIRFVKYILIGTLGLLVIISKD